MITIHHNFGPEQFEWLWAKYVNGGNIKQHCFTCLKGTQSKKIGDVLAFTEDTSITMTVATNRKVICNGKETYLTPLTNELRGKSSRMGKYWIINGKTIAELYYETYFPNGKTFAEYQAEEEERRNKKSVLCSNLREYAKE